MSRTRKAGMDDTVRSFLSRQGNLIVLGIGLVVAFLVFTGLTDLKRDTYWFEASFFMPFAFYMMAVYWAYTTQQKKAGTSVEALKRTRKTQKEILLVIMVFAIVFRAIFIFTIPTVSDDIYRFYWEGKVAANGINPYQYAPDALELEDLRDPNYYHMNNRDVPSPYPPFSQMTFMYCYLMFPSTDAIFMFKAFFTFFDVLSIYVLYQLLRGFKIDPRMSVVYAWSPLVVMEFSHSGHNDSMAIFFVLLSFLALQKGDKLTSGAALALGALTKIYPLLLAPLLIKTWGKKGMAVFAAMMGLFYLPYLGAGQQVFAGISEYTDRWFFNGSVFAAIIWILEQAAIATSRAEAMFIGKIVVALMLAPVLCYLVYRSRARAASPVALFKYSFVAIGLFLLLTSTVHPWYITWVIPFLCVFLSPSWLLLSGTTVLSYIIYIRFDTAGVWDEALWVRLAEYIPFYIILAIEVLSFWLLRKEKPRRPRAQRPKRARWGEDE